MFGKSITMRLEMDLVYHNLYKCQRVLFKDINHLTLCYIYYKVYQNRSLAQLPILEILMNLIKHPKNGVNKL